MTTHLRTSTHVSTRPRSCEWCGSAIIAGSRYVNSVYIDNGLYTLTAHTGCDDIVDWWMSEYGVPGETVCTSRWLDILEDYTSGVEQ